VDIIINVFELGIPNYLNKDGSEINQSDLVKTADQMNEIFAAIGKNPIYFTAYTSALGAAVGIGYNVNKDMGNPAGKFNDFLKSNGVDVTKQTFTLVDDDFGRIMTKFGGAISEKNVSLTADNSFSFQFNSSVSVSAQFGLGVNVPLGLGSFKSNFRNMTPVNMGLGINLKLRF
jgi:hypothetical protein